MWTPYYPATHASPAKVYIEIGRPVFLLLHIEWLLGLNEFAIIAAHKFAQRPPLGLLDFPDMEFLVPALLQ